MRSCLALCTAEKSPSGFYAFSEAPVEESQLKTGFGFYESGKKSRSLKRHFVHLNWARYYLFSSLMALSRFSGPVAMHN